MRRTEDALGFELVRRDDGRKREERAVDRDDTLGHVERTVVAHDRFECRVAEPVR